MSRNTVRFSAFSTIVLARCCVALLLIAISSFYYLALWVMSCIVAMVAVSGVRRIVSRIASKQRSRRSGMQPGKHYREPYEQTDYFSQQIGQNAAYSDTLQPARQQAVVLMNGLLPGLPPICLN